MDINQILEASKAAAQNLIPVITGSAAFLGGFYLIGSSVVSLIKKGDQQSQDRITWAGIGGKLFIGALLMQLPATMESVSNLLFAQSIQDYHGALAYVATPVGGGSGFYKGVIETCFIWATMLGWIAAFRGFLQWSSAASGDSGQNGGDMFWKGVWHIAGGACLINMTGFISSFLGR